MKTLFAIISCICFLYLGCFFNVNAISNDDSFAFRVLDFEQKGSISNFVVLSDGSFAISYDNEAICYYSKDMEFIYCLKILDVKGTILLCEYKENVAFVQSRYQDAYVIQTNDNQVSVERIHEKLVNYNSAEFWRENDFVEFQQCSQKYILKRHSLYDKIFNSKINTFEILDSNGTIIFSRVESQSQTGKLLLFIFIVIIVVFAIIILFKKRNQIKN